MNALQIVLLVWAVVAPIVAFTFGKVCAERNKVERAPHYHACIETLDDLRRRQP